MLFRTLSPLFAFVSAVSTARVSYPLTELMKDLEYYGWTSSLFIDLALEPNR